MKLTDYARILMRRGWMMLLLAIIAGGSAYTLSKDQTPIYRSTQTVLVSPSRTDLSLVESSRNLLESHVVYLNSEIIAERIIEELSLDMTSGQLMSNVTIASDKFRMVIQIDVDNADGEIANLIARAWGQQLVDYRTERNATVRREDRVDALLVDYPRYHQQAPKPKVMAVAGGVLGLLVGGVFVFVLEYLESSVIRRNEDLERVSESQVLASIPPF